MDLIRMYLKKQALREGRNVKRQTELEQKQAYGPVIREWRRWSWITQENMARDIGVSEKRLRDFEHGEQVDRFEELNKACEWYLSFRHRNLAGERLTTESWQELRQAELRQIEWRRANNII